MVTVQSPRPRSILKHPPPLSVTPPSPRPPIVRTESTQLLSIDPSVFRPLVHFPSASSLSRTFFAHSAATYDRTPIVVPPNNCSLPERGCPGRTYHLEDGEQTINVVRELIRQDERKARGRSPSPTDPRRHISALHNLNPTRVDEEALADVTSSCSIAQYDFSQVDMTVRSAKGVSCATIKVAS
ncbi:hypothetical protein PHLCEN_2v920 [Hermanssonia centrifuga]|uniref:Uncharacterized protein n=1 Tax=Hermanssonia centrifuga TaxID=98765 RepID=A0A2R6S4M2_9APHY|nr:hypothetical protein PHLCEN_2v920 [Hermanssonia centrifuga]